MKKILSMFAVAVMGGFVLASCDNDDTTNEIATHGLQVTSAKTSFDAKGGTQSISVAATPTSAYSNDNWATVAINGNTVNVTAAQNNDRQTRHTTIVIKSSPLDSAIVNVDQDGMVFALNASSIVIGDNASRRAYAVKHNLDVKVSTNTNWLQTTLNGDSLAITAKENATGEPRQGWVYYSSGDVTDSISVLQFEVEKDVLGDYALVYYDEQARDWYYTPTNLYHATDGSYAMRFTNPSLASYGWVVPITVTEDTPSFYFNNLSNIGTITSGSSTYSVLWMVLMDDGKDVYTYSYSSLRATANYTIDEDGSSYWPFTISMNVGYEFYGFQLGLSTDGTTYNSSLGTVLSFVGAYFEKMPATDDSSDASAAKSFSSVKDFKGSKVQKRSSSARWKAPELLPNKTLKAL